MGSLRLQRKMMVVQMYDEVLLGADILLKEPEGPVDIMASKNVMLLKGHSLPLVAAGVPPQTRRVRSKDHHIIPAVSEVIVDAFVDRWQSETEPGELLVRPGSELARRSSEIMAPCLMDVTRKFLWTNQTI